MKISAVIRHFLKIFSTEVQKKISSHSSEVQKLISAVVRRTSADFIPTLSMGSSRGGGQYGEGHGGGEQYGGVLEGGSMGSSRKGSMVSHHQMLSWK